MKTKKVEITAKKAADAMLREMVIKFGVIFMSDFDDVELDNPLYIALYDSDGEIKPSPIFPRRDIAEEFVVQCRKHLPNFKNKKVRIFRLKAL